MNVITGVCLVQIFIQSMVTGYAVYKAWKDPSIRLAWGLIATAFLLMTMRRVTALALVPSDPEGMSLASVFDKIVLPLLITCLLGLSFFRFSEEHTAEMIAKAKAKQELAELNKLLLVTQKECVEAREALGKTLNKDDEVIEGKG